MSSLSEPLIPAAKLIRSSRDIAHFEGQKINEISWFYVQGGTPQGIPQGVPLGIPLGGTPKL